MGWHSQAGESGEGATPICAYRVLLPYCCALIEVFEGQIVETAPIFNWARGRPYEEFAGWVRRKQGTISLLGD